MAETHIRPSPLAAPSEAEPPPPVPPTPSTPITIFIAGSSGSKVVSQKGQTYESIMYSV